MAAPFASSFMRRFQTEPAAASRASKTRLSLPARLGAPPAGLGAAADDMAASFRAEVAASPTGYLLGASSSGSQKRGAYVPSDALPKTREIRTGMAEALAPGESECDRAPLLLKPRRPEGRPELHRPEEDPFLLHAVGAATKDQGALFDSLRSELEARISRQFDDLVLHQRSELFSLRQEFKSRLAIVSGSHAQELRELGGRQEDNGQCAGMIEAERQERARECGELLRLIQAEREERIRSCGELGARCQAGAAQRPVDRPERMETTGDVPPVVDGNASAALPCPEQCDGLRNCSQHLQTAGNAAMVELRLSGLEAHVKTLEEEYSRTLREELDTLRAFAQRYETTLQSGPWDVIRALHTDFLALRRDVDAGLGRAVAGAPGKACADAGAGGASRAGPHTPERDVNKLAEALGVESMVQCDTATDVDQHITKDIGKSPPCTGAQKAAHRAEAGVRAGGDGAGARCQARWKYSPAP